MEHVTFWFEIIGLRMFGLVKHGLTLDNPGSGLYLAWRVNQLLKCFG